MEQKQIFRASRIAALQELFSKEFNTELANEGLSRDRLIVQTVGSKTIVDGVVEYKDQIDEIINKYAKNWTVKRMNKIDATILRIAIYELNFAEQKLDKAIIINEAIEVAKEYGSDKSYKFVNGILDSYTSEM